MVSQNDQSLITADFVPTPLHFYKYWKVLIQGLPAKFVPSGLFVMSTEGVAVEQPAQEVSVHEQVVAPEQAKEKKSKQAKASSHPPYFQVC